MKRLYVSTRDGFSTAHFYNQKQWNSNTNDTEFGLCYSEYGHGHNYSLDVTFSVLRSIAVNVSEYEKILKKVKSLITVILRDFDHRHLNFTHPDFTSNERISTTEVLTEVIYSSLEKIWDDPNTDLKPDPPYWSGVTLHGVQVWETGLLAAVTEKSFVCLARPILSWSTAKIHHAIRLTSGESRSLEITLPTSLALKVDNYLKSMANKTSSLEALCCAIQEHFQQPIFMKTKSDYFLLAE